MRLVSFVDGSGARRPGVLQGQTVLPFGPDVPTLTAFIAAAPAERERALAATGAPIALGSVCLDAPLAPHKNVFCVGKNYAAHAAEIARASGATADAPTVPTFFTKAPTAIVGPEAVLRLDPAVSQKYDWEAELAVVIGSRCRDVSEADALSVVFGYTALNDVTARDLQRLHLQWFKGKSLDATCPLGPWIVDAAEIGDPQCLNIALRVNGETRQNGHTSDMIFSVRQIIASLSRGMTLEPGDIIATGTPDGVGMGMEPPVFLRDGDVMEVQIERIGILRNRVALTAPAAAVHA